MNGKPTYEELVQSIKELDKELSDKNHLINALKEKLTKFEMISEDRSSGDEKNKVSNINIEWNTEKGICTLENFPVAIMWIDTTLAGLMSGLQAMVGTERFNLALQSEGRKSVDADWMVISQFSDFCEGFKAISNIAAVAGWGKWKLISLDKKKKECLFRVKDSWEGRYQKALGVCWGSGMLAGKMAGYCSKLFDTNCWAEQKTFIAKGGEFDEFVAAPSERSIEIETENLLATDEATRADMAVALQKLQREVNERQRAEKSLIESEEKYRDLVESANSIILRWDIEGNITYMNPYGLDFFGYSMEELLGKNVVGTIVPETESTTTRDLTWLMKDIQRDPDKYKNNENENTRKDGRRVWISWTNRAIMDKDGNPAEILSIGNDITEKKMLETRLRRAEKMEAIGTLAGGVAHDLNNVLSGIVSYPDLLLMQLPEESPLRKPMHTIRESGEKAAAIVHNLLTLTRRGVAITEVANLNTIIQEYLKSPEFEKLRSFHPNLEIEIHLEKDILNILGSPVHLSGTLANLVSNAAEAMPKGGKFSISTENRYIDSPVSGYDDVAEGDYVVLEVSDTGKGVPPEYMNRIFEPFFTKKKMGRSGTGLGMSVVWGTVKDHNGYIDVKSTEREGTTFSLFFPATRQKLSRKGTGLHIEDYMGRGESILVVDDVEVQRQIAFTILSELGYSVTTASSGEEALDYMKNNCADLLVLDMIMPQGMDGLDTYRKIVELHPNQKAIIASGFSETVRVKEVQRLGAGQYLRKPYTLESIGIAVKNELSKQ